MAITNKESGVWSINQVSKKINEKNIWDYKWGASLYLCGYGDDGANGQNNVVNYSSPVQVPGSYTGVSVACNDRIVAAVKTDGTLWTWGKDYNGSAGWNSNGQKRSSPVQVSGFPPSTGWEPIYDRSIVRCSILSTSYVDEDGSLFTWGRNEGGQLGHGNRTHYSSPTLVGARGIWSQNIATNDDEHRYCVRRDGTLWAWGSGANGALGQNNQTSYSSPKQVGTHSYWSTEIGTLSRSEQVTAAIRTDGTLYTWGENYEGQIGNNTEGVNMSSPIQVGTESTWRYIGNAGRAFLATKTDGTLWSWGNNTYGQLGVNDRTTRSSPTQIPGTNWFRAVDCKRQACACTKTDGTLWVWGRNQKGSLGLNNVINYSSPVQFGSGTWWNNAPARSAASMGGSSVGSGAYLIED